MIVVHIVPRLISMMGTDLAVQNYQVQKWYTVQNWHALQGNVDDDKSSNK